MALRKYIGGGQAGNWGDPANWQGGKAPGISDTAQVFGGGDQMVGSVTVNNIMVLGAETVTFDSTVVTAGIGNCQGFMVCAGATTVFAPGSTLNDGGVLQAGVLSTGTLVADGSSAKPTSITAKSFTLGKDAAGIGIVTLDDATVAITNTVLVGDMGVGTLTVVDGADLQSAGFVVGLHAGATGSVTVSNGGAITVAGSAEIGCTTSQVAGGTGTLTVTTGSTFSAGKGVTVASGSAIDLTGGTVSASAFDVRSGGLITGTGTLTAATGGWLADNGGVVASGGALTINASVGGTGSVTIDAGSTAAITGKSVLAQQLTFAGSDGTLSLVHGAAVRSVVSGFTFGDQIEMAGIDKAVWNGTTGILTLSDAGHRVDTLHLGGSYTGDVFQVAQSGGLGVVTLHTA